MTLNRRTVLKSTPPAEQVGVDLQFQVLEWEASRARQRAGAMSAENKQVDGLNHSWEFWDPDIGLVNDSWSVMKPTSTRAPSGRE